MPTTMNKNALIAAKMGIAAVLLIAVVWLVKDYSEKRGDTQDCGNGDIRHTIDLRDFTTSYSAYSVEFEASVVKQGKIAAKLEPKQLQQLSEAMQQSREFRQYVVSGYNGCAITKAQYADFGIRFQALDSVARQIDNLAGREPEQIANLVREYVRLSHSLGSAK